MDALNKCGRYAYWFLLMQPLESLHAQHGHQQWTAKMGGNNCNTPGILALVHHHRLSRRANYLFHLLCRNRHFAGTRAICLECCNYCRPSRRLIADDCAGHADLQVVASIRSNKHIARIYSTCLISHMNLIKSTTASSNPVQERCLRKSNSLLIQKNRL